MNEIIEYLPFLIPIMLIAIVLAIYAIFHILKHPNYRCGNKTLWLIIVIFIQIIGPIIYFIFGKEKE